MQSIMQDKADLVVIGAGQAALTLAETLRRAGDRRSITLVGAEHHPPYQRPPLSKAYLSGKMEKERLWLKPRAWYLDNNIKLLTGCKARTIDRQARTVIRDDGRRMGYEELVIATGSRPRCFPRDLGGGLRGVHTIRGLDDIDRLSPDMARARRLVVIGGGYIGLEAAAIARARGIEVTLVEAGPRILARVACETTAKMVRDLHDAKGVILRENVGVDRIGGDKVGAVTQVHLSDGSISPADVVIVGIGALANDELAREAGLHCQPSAGGGVLVDIFCRTSDPAIYAIGDVAASPIAERVMRLESVQNACDQARALASTLLGTGVAYMPTPWFWSDQYDMKLQIAGLNLEADSTVFRPGPKPGTGSVWYFRGSQLTAIDALSDPRAYMNGKRWLEQGVSPCVEQVCNPKADLKTAI
jgi:3-phenylpropionate/trans-cinnamate dioxygenase ferredoxin reductase component